MVGFSFLQVTAHYEGACDGGGVVIEKSMMKGCTGVKRRLSAMLV